MNERVRTFYASFGDVFRVIRSAFDRAQDLLIVIRQRAVFFFSRVDVNLEAVLFTICIVEAVFHAALARVQHSIQAQVFIVKSNSVFSYVCESE